MEEDETTLPPLSVLYGYTRRDGLPRNFPVPETKGVTWYSYLAETRGDASLLRRESYKPNVEFLVCLETSTTSSTAAATRRVYAKFASNTHFFAWFRTVPQEHRCFYEIVMGHARQKPYFDIDLSVESAKSAGINSKEDMEKIISQFISSSIVLLLDSSSSIPIDALVYSSNSSAKYSYHIVFTGVSLNGNTETRAFFEAARDAAVMAHIPGAFISALDEKVYGPKQNFRLVGCKKYGSDRVKTLCISKHFHTEDLLAFDTRQAERKQFCKSLITDLSGTEMISRTSQFVAILEEREAIRLRIIASRAAAVVRVAAGAGSGGGASEEQRGMVSELNREEADALVAMVRGRIKQECGDTQAPFRLRDAMGPFVSDPIRGGVVLALERTSPSMCMICRRSHEHDHPFIVVRPYSRLGEKTTVPQFEAVFFCRRASSGGGAATGAGSAGVSIPLPKGLLQPSTSPKTGGSSSGRSERSSIHSYHCNSISNDRGDAGGSDDDDATSRPFDPKYPTTITKHAIRIKNTEDMVSSAINWWDNVPGSVSAPRSLPTPRSSLPPRSSGQPPQSSVAPTYTRRPISAYSSATAEAAAPLLFSAPATSATAGARKAVAKMSKRNLASELKKQEVRSRGGECNY